MRVLWLTEHYPPSRGGTAESCDRIVRGLREAGAEVDVANLTRRDRPWQVEREYGGRLLTAPLGDNPEHALRRLWTELTGEAYTHVVAFGGTYAMLGAPVLAAWLGAPPVTCLRGNDFDTGVFSLRRREALLTALRASARVCVVARSHAPLVSALVPDAPVTWISNGIDTANWEILPSERARVERWRASPSSRDGGWSGSSGSSRTRRASGSCSTRCSPPAVPTRSTSCWSASWRTPSATGWTPWRGPGCRSWSGTTCPACTRPATSSPSRRSTTACERRAGGRRTGDTAARLGRGRARRPGRRRDRVHLHGGRPARLPGRGRPRGAGDRRRAGRARGGGGRTGAPGLHPGGGDRRLPGRPHGDRVSHRPAGR